MKKSLLLAAMLALMASCSNETEVTDNGAGTAGTEKTVIDLNAMTYEGVMETLAAKTELGSVEFKDGTLTRTTSLTASDATDPNQTDMLVFNSAEQDSVELAVGPAYVSVRMTVDGEMYAYLAYADDAEQQKVAEVYAQSTPATRAGAATTRITENGALKLNLSAMRQQMEENYKQTGTYEMEGSFNQPVTSGVVTRGLFSNLWKKVKSVFTPAPKPVVKTPTIDIYLMKEKGANPATHEMNWQVNDAISSLKDVENNVKFNVHIVNCDFKGTSNSTNDLRNFRSWVQNSGYRNTNGIFFLCRWGGWSDVLGMAYVNDYNVNTDTKAYGISCTNAWNKFTMAHEIGHNFGAEHVATKWYQVFWTSDLMSASSYDWLSSGKHKDSANRNKIKANMTLK